MPALPVSYPRQPSSRPARWRLGGRRTAVLVVLVVLVVWNVVFDNRMKAAIVQYVHLQQLYVAGAGPRIDVDRAMQEGVRRGLRDATIAAAAAAAVVAALARRRGPA